jgi:thermostable 8-oxoguanine DNA glycosylase
MITINNLAETDIDFENAKYSYQTELTSKLDNLNSDFNQEIINEVVLWKVNRFAAIDSETLNLINKIKKTDTIIDQELTTKILLKLLHKKQKGIRLAVASTILRFKNPKIYQIIDQRVYRFIYGEELKHSETDINQQILIYFNYLDKLKQICLDRNINFEVADRILYSLDKIHNSDNKLYGY